MERAMDERIRNIWSELQEEPEATAHLQKRKYRRLDLEKETGLRISCYFPGRLLELLVEIGPLSKKPDYSFPNWKGMAFDLIQLDTPVSGTWHICLRLEKAEHRDVFTSVCSDLAEELQSIASPIDRKEALLDFMERWSSFFERYSLQGLSEERQRGLFGELWWMRRLVDAGIAKRTAVDSWKGCHREYHDYEINGNVVEVKTTLSKEPRKVQISNERQLDERGLVSLHLLVLTLVQAQMGGESLPRIVAILRQSLSGDASSLRRFERSLHEAGYLEIHSHLYDASYTAKTKEFFRVAEGFPKITEVPPGLGDLKYTLLIGACASYLVDMDEYIDTLKGESHDN
jgi:hypothetical protein